LKNKESLYLNVKIHPRSARQEITRLDADSYRVRVKAAPSKGEANKELIKIIAVHFDVTASQVKIIRGHKSRNKVVAVTEVR